MNADFWTIVLAVVVGQTLCVLLKLLGLFLLALLATLWEALT